MPFELERIDAAGWDADIQLTAYASPFHEYAWNEMIAEQFEQDFLAYRASRGTQAWLVPAYRQEQGLRSSFIGYGGPLPLHEVIDGRTELETSIEVLRELKTEVGASTVQGTLYPANYWPESAPSVEMAKTTIVDINFTPEDLFRRVISGNCRTAVRKAAKHEVQTRLLSEDDDYEQIARLLNQTQRRVGSSYVTSVEILRSISTLAVPTVTGQTYVAEINDQPIAMSTVVSNRNEAFHLFSGWDREYANFCAVQALHWKSILRAQEYGASRYNMGESHTPELLAAKLRWGGRLVTVPRLSL